MRRPFLTSTLFLTLLASAGEAAARPPPTGTDTAVDVAIARSLLEEGKKLARDGQLKEAIDKLEASERRDPTPEGLLEIGNCQEKLGTTATAWGTFHRAEERAKMLGDQARAQQAASQASALEPKLARLRVMVTPSEMLPDVAIDDRELEKDAWGVVLPLDPGPHTVTAHATGRLPFSKTFELLASQSVEVEIPVLSPPLPSAPRRPAPAPAPDGAPPVAALPAETWITPPSRRHSPPNWNAALAAGITLLCAGVGVGGAGLVLLAKNQDGTPLQTAGFAMMPGGIVVGSAGLTLLVVASNKLHMSLAPPRFTIGPMVARSGSGLTLHGTF